ncbi:hypothetical protein HDU76_011465 [Blyttiomyces sp. JEL0837]|nr:hypothetical protein HDU76_011465 [Blyttiomyces sp. JEL0837]
MFSGVLQVSDLNDFVGPSQACIKPVEIKKTAEGEQSSLQIDPISGGYYEVSKDGEQKLLETATISLNDCLACSGCITSAESILVSSQSHQDLLTILESNKQALAQNEPYLHKIIVISLSPQSRASIASKYKLHPLTVHRKLVSFFTQLGVHHVVDSSFARDFALIESGREFVKRYREANGDFSLGVLPMLASACPGWICYAEKTHGNLLPNISNTKSPQQIMGSLVKNYLGGQLGVNPDKIYHISVMPCYDKKLEASRSDFYNDVYRTRDVDTVLTTGEVERIILRDFGVRLEDIPEIGIPALFTKAGPADPIISPDNFIVYGSEGSSSGGYLSFIFRYAARELFGIQLSPEDLTGCKYDTHEVEIRPGRNVDYHEIVLKLQSGVEVLRFAAAYGFRNIQNLVRKVQTPNGAVVGGPIRTPRGRRANAANASGSGDIHFVEVMACPSGCINGGGQVKADVVEGDAAGGAHAPASKAFVMEAENVYKSVAKDVDNVSRYQGPEENQTMIELYSSWLGGPDTQKAWDMLHTRYHAIKPLESVNGLAVKW